MYNLQSNYQDWLVRSCYIYFRIRTLEAEKQEIELVQKALKEKDEYATTLGEKLKKCMEELAVLENRFVEDQTCMRFTKIFAMDI